MMSFDPSSANAEYIDQLYEQYRENPASLDAEWVGFFKGFEFGYQQHESATVGELTPVLVPARGNAQDKGARTRCCPTRKRRRRWNQIRDRVVRDAGTDVGQTPRWLCRGCGADRSRRKTR